MVTVSLQSVLRAKWKFLRNIKIPPQVLTYIHCFINMIDEMFCIADIHS